MLHSLPPDVYALVNHQEAAKDIWDRVKLLMKGIELFYYEAECRLLQLIRKFDFVQGEIIVWSITRVIQLINDMPYIGYGQCQQVKVSIQFSKWLSTGMEQVSISLINLRTSSIPEIRAPFQDGRVQFNKFKEDKLRVLLALDIEELLQPQRETMELVKQRDPWNNKSLSCLSRQSQNSAFRMIDLDAYDSDYDDISSARAVLMANLSSCDSDVFSETCASLTKPTEKLVAVTPMNKDKKVRFAEPVTSSCNIPKQTDSLRTKDSNKPLLTSTGVNTNTSASG
ncbi:hypothetical protein Tco_0632284 [Tanacetum coccineum]